MSGLGEDGSPDVFVVETNPPRRDDSTWTDRGRVVTLLRIYTEASVEGIGGLAFVWRAVRCGRMSQDVGRTVRCGRMNQETYYGYCESVLTQQLTDPLTDLGM